MSKKISLPGFTENAPWEPSYMKCLRELSSMLRNNGTPIAETLGEILSSCCGPTIDESIQLAGLDRADWQTPPDVYEELCEYALDEPDSFVLLYCEDDTYHYLLNVEFHPEEKIVLAILTRHMPGGEKEAYFCPDEPELWKDVPNT